LCPSHLCVFGSLRILTVSSYAAKVVFVVSDLPGADGLQAYKGDLHIHTSASRDYKQADVSPLHVVEHAAEEGLRIIAITDHNTMAGYENILGQLTDTQRFIERAEKHGDRVSAEVIEEEKASCERLRRILFGPELLVLPGIEIGVEGIHVLSLFDPGDSVDTAQRKLRDINYRVLAPLGVLEIERTDQAEIRGRTVADVLEAVTDPSVGGIVIMPHVRGSHGFHETFESRKQTRKDYFNTGQISAMEVKNPGHQKQMAEVYGGGFAGYTAYAEIVMGSDAHLLRRAETEKAAKSDLEIGERMTRFYLAGLCFAELRLALAPSEQKKGRYVRTGREEQDELGEVARSGPGRTVHFVGAMPTAPDDANAIELAHAICSFANSEDGTIYIGMNPVPTDGEFDIYQHTPGLSLADLGLDAGDGSVESHIHAFVQSAVDPPDVPLTVACKGVDIGGHVVELHVEKSLGGPYVCSIDGSVRVRADAGARPASSEDIQGLIADLVRSSVEEEVLEAASDQIESQKRSLDAEMARSKALEERAQQAEDRERKERESVERLQRELHDSQAAAARRPIPRPHTGVQVVDHDYPASSYRDLRTGHVGSRLNDEVDGTWRIALSKFEHVEHQEPAWHPIDAEEDPDHPGLYLRRDEGWVDIYDLTHSDPTRHRYFFSCRVEDLTKHEFWRQALERSGLSA